MRGVRVVVVALVGVARQAIKRCFAGRVLVVAVSSALIVGSQSHFSNAIAEQQPAGEMYRVVPLKVNVLKGMFDKKKEGESDEDYQKRNKNYWKQVILHMVKMANSALVKEQILLNLNFDKDINWNVAFGDDTRISGKEIGPLLKAGLEELLLGTWSSRHIVGVVI